jgi:hypothetical protein
MLCARGMRFLIGLIGVAVLGCSTTELALAGLSMSATAQNLEIIGQHAREAERERRCQESTKCCATKSYDSTTHSWRCTACDD